MAGGLLFFVTLAIYIQAVHFGFVQPEDEIHYFEARSRLDAGGSPVPESLRMPSSALYWVPVSNFLLFIDVFMCGDQIGLLHLINLLFHAASSLLLFLILRLASGRIWQSLFAAALFGLHPMNTEAVVTWCWGATLAEGLLFLATFLAYLHYARGPNAARYLAVIFCFVLGLLARPSILYLPVLLLLFDFWPLGRWRPAGAHQESRFAVRSPGKLIWEKIPLLMIAGAWLAAALYAIRLMPAFPGSRNISAENYLYLFNLPVAYALFLRIMVFPVRLPSYFPDPLKTPSLLPFWQVLLAAAVLVAVCVLVVRKGRRYPFLVTGWLWFLIALFPSAVVCVAQHRIIMERLGYLPMIGMFIIVAWGGPLLLRKAGLSGKASIAAAVLIAVVLSLVSGLQARHWSDRISYFRQAVATHPDSEKAHSDLGEVLYNAGRIDEAMACFETALRLNPDYAVAHNHLALLLNQRGERARALAHWRRAVQADPGYAQAHNNLANLLADLGDMDGAVAHYQQALQIDSTLFQVHNNLATVLMAKGDFPLAVRHLEESLRINPEYKMARDNLLRVRQMMQNSRGKKDAAASPETSPRKPPPPSQ